MSALTTPATGPATPASGRGSSIDGAALEGLLMRLLATPGLSAEEGAVAVVLQEELRSLGMTVDVDEMGNVTGRLELGPGPTVMLDCHLDTVPIGEASQWSRDPAGEIVDGVVYGRGTVDMKGPLAAAVHGVASLRALSAGTVVVSGSVAEELVEGPAAIAVASAVRPDFVVICEPSQRRIARGQRGRAEVVVEVDGVSAHSAYPAAGINAAEVMADVVTALRALAPPADPVLGDGVLVLIDVLSQPYPSLSTLPASCRATFDRRLLVGEHQAQVLAPIQAVVDEVTARWSTRGRVRVAASDYTTYTGVPVHAPKFAPAWLFSKDEPVVAGAVRGLTDAGLDAHVEHYRFCTNGSGTAGVLGIPTIGYGPGHEDQAHTVDESIELTDLHLGAHGYAAIVASLLTAGVAA